MCRRLVLLMLPFGLLACRAAEGPAPPEAPARTDATAPAAPAAPQIAAADTVGLGQAVATYLVEEGVVPGAVVYGAYAGQMARVEVLSGGPGTAESSTLYLERDAKGWRVIGHGTAFGPSELDGLGIPASVRR